MAATATKLTMDAEPPKDIPNCTNPANPGVGMDADHPEGEAIRRQVEYYFSDENLPTDLHLLRLCGGHENLPILMGEICSFKKMRKYKPRTLVVTALRRSEFLEVSTDGKTIKRKTPLQEKCLLDKDYCENGEIAYDPRTRRPIVHPIPQIQPNNPHGLSQNMLKPTGFEKTFIEPPQTQAEAAEEKALYDLDKPFVERIEIAIQRFKQRRRMHQMYAIAFNKLMRFGGVDFGPRMYQGLSTQEAAEMDAEERVRALATHHVPWDRSNTKRWTVDFVGVGKAFLSSWYPTHYGYADDKIKNACQVLRSFYNYLLYHRVCPEYDDQLHLARDLCDTAEQELPQVNAAVPLLPGHFNKSASVILGGAHADMHIGDRAWAEELRKEGINSGETGLSHEEARIKFDTGVAIMGSDEQYKKLMTTGFSVVRKESVGLEVTAINAPDDLVKEGYAEQSNAVQHKLRQLEPLGKLLCKSWYFEDCDEWDLPRDNDKYPNGRPNNTMEGKEYTFWIEDTVLEQCFMGMKLDAKILILEEGLVILDDVSEVMCSFFTWLPNELWMERKPKEVRWLEKEKEVDEENELEVEGDKKGSKAASDDEFDDE